MSSYTLTAGRASFASTAAAQAKMAEGALGALAPQGLLARLQSWLQYRRTIRELSRLSDRELADIGLERSDIEAVARGTWHG